MPFDVDKAIELRSQCEHFRILVIGRANAGKTTLLKKVCDSLVDPEILSPSGEQISSSTLEGSAERGKHNINNEMIFKSNPQFIFHDSRGFESGSDDELNKITDFIAKRAATHKLSEQLHAIWYCLPTDTTRPLLTADEEFFGTRIAGRVPVIAIFTKFDGLINEAFTELLDEGLLLEAAKEGETERAKMLLVNNFETPLMLTQFPPSDYVQLDDMREKTSSCNELIAKTANALSDDTLRLLFVSVQQNNIYLSIHYAVNAAWGEWTIRTIMKSALAYFPHVYMNAEYDDLNLHDRRLIPNRDRDQDIDYDDRLLHNLRRDDSLLRRIIPHTLSRPSLIFYSNVDACITFLKRTYPRLAESSLPISECSKLVAAICICAEQTFTEASAKEEGFPLAFSAALDLYLTSSLQEAVNREIATLSPQVDRMTKVIKLVEIIQSHPLRIHPLKI